MVTTKEEEEEHVMHPKEAEDDDIEDSDSDFDPIGFGIEERIRQVQSWFFSSCRNDLPNTGALECQKHWVGTSLCGGWGQGEKYCYWK